MPYSPLSLLLLLLLQVEEAVDIIGGEVRKMFG
jgi:hypothetical protein